MAIYGLAQRTSAIAAGAPSWEIMASSTNKPRVLEIGLTQVTAVANGNYAIGRTSAIGVTPTTPQNFVDESDGNGPAAQTTAAVAWGSAPTSTGMFIRKFSCTNVIGNGAIFSFPRGLLIPSSNSLAIWNASTVPACDVYAVIDE